MPANSKREATVKARGYPGGSSRLRPLPFTTTTRTRNSASCASRLSFFLSGWKHGVTQGRHRLHRRFLRLGWRRGGKGQRQRRLWRLGREAGADRRPGECGSCSQAHAGRRSLPSALPAAFPCTGGPCSLLTALLLHLHFCSKDTTALPIFR